MSSVVPDDLFAAAFQTDPADLPPPLGWNLTLDLGGCDETRISERKTVADWGERLAQCIDADLYGQPVIDFFGDDLSPGLAVRYRLNQRTGWHGVARPARVEAIVRCAPSTHGVHIDVLSRAAFEPGPVADLCRDYFAARCGTGTYRARRVPSLLAGFRYDWKGTP